MRKLLLAALTIPLLSLCGSSKEPAAPVDVWAPYRFMIGDWVGEGSGQSGQGKGEFSLAPDLHGKILLRKHQATFPAAGGRPAFTHEDLLIVYQEGDKDKKAIYFDSEGHVIHYTPIASQDGQAIAFVSEAAKSSPRYRLTYTKTADARLQIKFELAPPGKPDAFKTYMEGNARRKERP